MRQRQSFGGFSYYPEQEALADFLYPEQEALADFNIIIMLCFELYSFTAGSLGSGVLRLRSNGYFQAKITFQAPMYVEGGRDNK